MKKIFIFIFCSITFLQTTAQLKEIFLDDFSSNKNQWAQEKAEGLYAKVENGKYVVECGPKNDFFPQIVFGIDSIEDYSISANISMIKSLLPDSGSGGGIIWGSNLSGYFCFYINSKGVAGVAEVKNNQLVYDKSENKKGVIKTGDGATNKLRIEKKDLIWDFFINDQLVGVLLSQDLKGLYVGFVALAGGKYEFDDLRISGTPVATSGNFCQLYPLIHESAKNNFSFIIGPKSVSNISISQRSCLTIEKDRPGGVLILDNYFNTFSIVIKNGTSREAAEKELRSLIPEFQNCLPSFQFTEGKDDKGELIYTINEKIKDKGPEIKSSIKVYTGYNSIYINLSILARRIK